MSFPRKRESRFFFLSAGPARDQRRKGSEIPAFAGMTVRVYLSFPRKRESRFFFPFRRAPARDQRRKGSGIPAFAGMTGVHSAVPFSAVSV